jgi:hypothetical protein
VAVRAVTREAVQAEGLAPRHPAVRAVVLGVRMAAPADVAVRVVPLAVRGERVLRLEDLALRVAGVGHRPREVLAAPVLQAGGGDRLVLPACPVPAAAPLFPSRPHPCT